MLVVAPQEYVNIYSTRRVTVSNGYSVTLSLLSNIPGE